MKNVFTQEQMLTLFVSTRWRNTLSQNGRFITRTEHCITESSVTERDIFYFK